MSRALIALFAALLFAIVAAVPANAVNHTTKKQRHIASVLLFRRAAPQRQTSPLDAVLEDPKKPTPAPQPVADWQPSPASDAVPSASPSEVEPSFTRSPLILASVLLL